MQANIGMSIVIALITVLIVWIEKLLRKEDIEGKSLMKIWLASFLGSFIVLYTAENSIDKVSSFHIKEHILTGNPCF